MSVNKRAKIEELIKMQYRLLGSTGLKVSVLSYGSWVSFHNQLNSNSAYDLMRFAYERGVNFFDNAETYAEGRSETVMGDAIKRGIADGVWERSDLVITTKIFFGTKDGVNAKGLSRKHIVEGLNASLKRLQLDYVDVVFCHRFDPLTPIEETVRAMNHVIDKGQAFYWSTSEWSCQQITEACLIADKLGLIRPISDQPQYNMFERRRVEIEYLPLYKQRFGLTIWSPLASGILSGKYSGKVIPENSRLALKNYEWLTKAKLEKPEQFELADKLAPIANELGCSLAQLAIAWCVKNNNVSTVILGATTMKQLEENLDSLKVVPLLTNEVMEKIEGVLNNKPTYDSVMQQVTNIRNLN